MAENTVIESISEAGPKERVEFYICSTVVEPLNQLRKACSFFMKEHQWKLRKWRSCMLESLLTESLISSCHNQPIVSCRSRELEVAVVYQRRFVSTAGHICWANQLMKACRFFRKELQWKLKKWQSSRWESLLTELFIRPVYIVLDIETINGAGTAEHKK